MTATIDRKKVRYFNKETNKLAWAYPDELPDYAVEAADNVTDDDTPEPEPAPAKINDYSAQIEEFRDELRTAIADRRVSRDEAGRTEALARSEQFKLAIDVYREAETIPAEPIQFGAYADTWSFRLPPRTPERVAENPRQMALFNRYVTNNPVEIAYLRRLVREQTIEGLQETPLNWYFGRGIGQRDGVWVDPATYEAQKKAGILQ